MTYPGLGGQQAPPQNASPAGQLVPGVQPGVSNFIVLAHTVIVFGPTGAMVGVFVYAAGTTPGAGNQPIASITNQTTDPYGNTVETGVAAYTTVGGDLIAVQIGLGSFFGSPAAGLFTHDLTAPAATDPFVGALGKGDIVISTGQSTGLATAAGIECTDSVVSGLANGNIQLVAGSISGTINMPQTPTQTLQGAAPAAYSQSFTQGTVNRVNTLINQLAAAGVTA